MFAGCGVLTGAFKDAGFGTDTPIEAYPSSRKYVASHDLSKPEVLAELEKNIVSRCYVDFGLPCISWSIVQMMNGGTRRSWRPEGKGSRAKEVEANVMAANVARLCCLQHEQGRYFSIENPLTSHLWMYGPVSVLLDVGIDVDFH